MGTGERDRKGGTGAGVETYWRPHRPHQCHLQCCTEVCVFVCVCVCVKKIE